MIAAGPGFLGYGASLLWTGPHHDKPALYDLRVIPGDAVVRRHADQLVSALPTGLKSPTVKLYARFQSSAKWDEIPMQPAGGGDFAGGYQFHVRGLPENVEYYVTAGAMTSKHFNIHVTDLPSVKQIQSYLSLPCLDRNAERYRRARRRSARGRRHARRNSTSSTDRPLNGRADPARQRSEDSARRRRRTTCIAARSRWNRTASITLREWNRASPFASREDFFIEARKANPPQIALVRPGRGDYHASPIEEVTVAAKAQAITGSRMSTLHYSVNGGPETRWICCGIRATKQADGATTLSLEEFQAGAGRSGQRLRDGEGRQRRIAHRHDLHPGRSVRARIFAIAAIGRRRRWWRRRRRRPIARRFRSGRKKSSRRLSSSRPTRRRPRSRRPKSRSSFRNRKPLCAIRL